METLLIRDFFCGLVGLWAFDTSGLFANSEGLPHNQKFQISFGAAYQRQRQVISSDLYLLKVRVSDSTFVFALMSPT